MIVKFPYKIKSVKSFTVKQALKYQLVNDGYVVFHITGLTLPEFDTIIEVETIK